MVAGGAIVALLAWLVDRRRRTYADLATTPAAAVFAGRNEVKGRAWTATPLVSQRTGTPSVWWSYRLEEEREHTRTSTDRDSDGHSHTRTETYHQWHEIDRQGNELPRFDVVDDTGSVPVRLDGARVEPREAFEEIFRRDADEGGFLEAFVSGRTGRYREREDVLAFGDQLFIAGEAQLDEQTCVPVLTGNVLVSTRSEESRTRWLGAGVGVLVVGAAGAITVGSGLLLAPDDAARPTAWLPGLAASALLLTIAWSTTLYNRLRLLAESAERAWTLIDVQLQRRHDLIPALVKVVDAHASHERTVLEGVADARWQAGRAQQTSELSGEAVEQTARLRQIIAVAEDHPQLTADASFLELQRTLADSESRIAGSRTFYNDTLLLLRNQMHRFPGVLVASRLRLAHRDPLGAEGFERTVPALERSFA